MKVTLQPSGVVVETIPGETILAAMQRTGLDPQHACREDDCDLCAALLVEGRVATPQGELTQGEIHVNRAAPVTDCLVQWDGVVMREGHEVQHFSCELVSIDDLGGDVQRVRLQAPQGTLPRYHAGQYMLVERADGKPSAFSLASSPGSGRLLELHVLAREASSIELLHQIRREGRARIQLPFGDAHLADLPRGPLILIAAGTGMAQMHSLIEDARARGFQHPVHLYWGVRTPEDFYAIECWDDWLATANLTLHRVVSDRCGWEGRCGLLHEAVQEDFADWRGAHVYASGSPAMVYATLDALVAAGMDAHQMRADVFAYAPRESSGS